MVDNGRKAGLTVARSDGRLREKFHKIAFDSDGSKSDPRTDWEPVISIGTAAGMVGLSPSALRKYEKEGLLIYHRTETGRRLLGRADIKRIRMIRHMIDDLGLNIEGIRRLLALLPCWDLKLCTPSQKASCSAARDGRRPCWAAGHSPCARSGEDCRECEVYRYGAYCAVTMKMLLHPVDDGR